MRRTAQLLPALIAVLLTAGPTGGAAQGLMKETASFCEMWKAFVTTPTPDCEVQSQAFAPGADALTETDPDVQFDGMPGKGTPVNLSFTNGSARLTASARRYLNTFGQVMTKASGLRVSVVGHANRTGSEDHNRWLSRERAKAVVRYLVQVAGLPPQRLQFDGVGSSKPLPGQRAEAEINRRVTIFSHGTASK